MRFPETWITMSRKPHVYGKDFNSTINSCSFLLEDVPFAQALSTVELSVQTRFCLVPDGAQ
jgi:hypothetical protein